MGIDSSNNRFNQIRLLSRSLQLATLVLANSAPISGSLVKRTFGKEK